MNPRLISRLPVTRIGALHTHPETSHLRKLSALAMACGNGTTLVEVGPTNGAVTVCLAETLMHNQESNLVVVGQIEEETAAIIEFLKVQDRVACVDDINEISGRLDLVFIGVPEQAEAAFWARDNNARVICVYDVRTAERYRLAQFAPLAEVAEELKRDSDRSWDEFSTAVSFEQARRGMLLSEAKSWSPNKRRDAAVISKPRQKTEVKVEKSKPVPASKTTTPVFLPPIVEAAPKKEEETVVVFTPVKAPEFTESIEPLKVDAPKPEGDTKTPDSSSPGKAKKKAQFKKRRKS